MSNSEWKSLAEKKGSSIYFNNFTDLGFSYTDIFFCFLWQMPVCFVNYAKPILYSEQSTGLLAWRNLNIIVEQFCKFKFHFEQFPGNTRFFSFGGPTNYFYLFKNHRQTFSWPEESPSSHLKVTKMWFGPNIKHISKTFADFCFREGISHFTSKIAVKELTVLMSIPTRGGWSGKFTLLYHSVSISFRISTRNSSSVKFKEKVIDGVLFC